MNETGRVLYFSSGSANTMARISAAKRSLDSQLKRCQTEIRFIKELADQLLTDNPIGIKRTIEQAFLNPAYASLVSKSIRAQEWWSIHLQAVHAADLAFQVQVALMLALKADAEQLHQKIKKDLAEKSGVKSLLYAQKKNMFHFALEKSI